MLGVKAELRGQVSLPLHSSAALGRNQHTGTICPKAPVNDRETKPFSLSLDRENLQFHTGSVAPVNKIEKEEQDRKRGSKREPERDLAFSITLTRNNLAKQP